MSKALVKTVMLGVVDHEAHLRRVLACRQAYGRHGAAAVGLGADRHRG
ncbi:MAG: hypothetical protein JOZ09_13470 [Pseudonocardiales bacterium]|nr:hypothetical protein [Pseudonocardiales bacterium]